MGNPFFANGGTLREQYADSADDDDDDDAAANCGGSTML